jgi:hypothetical protein
MATVMVQLQKRQKTIIYSDYTLQEVSNVFSLTIAQRPLLPAIEPVEPPAWLSEWLERTIPFALGSEKSPLRISGRSNPHRTDTLLVIDRQRYYLDNLARLLGALKGITAPYQDTP